MKTLLLVIVAGILAAGTSASVAEEPAMLNVPWYYSSPCQQPEGVSLYDWLTNLEVSEASEHGWDCSMGSAYVEWLAENCGYNTMITCRLPKDHWGHCWVTVEGEHFETMGLLWVSDEDPYVIEANAVFEDIDAAWDYVGKPHEWGWWISYPGLRGGEQ